MERARQQGLQDPTIEAGQLDPRAFEGNGRLAAYLRLRNGLVDAKMRQQAIGDDTAPEWVEAHEAMATIRDEARELGFSTYILGEAANHRIKQLREREAKHNGKR